MLPMPPTITTTRMMIDTRIMKLFGNTEPTLAARTAPLTAAIMAPTTKAMSFALTVLMPIASATCSSSRMAIQARPSLDAWSRHDT